MTVQGHACSDWKVVAEQINNYFATVRERNRQGDCNFCDYLTHKIDNCFSFHFFNNTATVALKLEKLRKKYLLN